MSVTPMRPRTLGAALVGTLALVACDDPVADTDLRPEGRPEVLAVLVFNDTTNGFVEEATYCRPDDEKRPGKVGIPILGISPIICPLDLTPVEPLKNAYPDAWYLRVVFDELLNPEVETLKPIFDAMGNMTDQFSGSLEITQPVTLRCEGVPPTSGGAPQMFDVPYDGYYSPAGNNVTWPLGPSLVIKPIDPTIVPVDSRCELTLKKDIVDKEGNELDGRDLMPFEFRIAPVSVISVSPAEGDTIDPSVGGVELTFNVEADSSASFCADPTMADCFSITPAASAEQPFVDNFGTGIFVGANIVGGQTYTFKAPANLKIKDKCGKETPIAGLPGTFEFETNRAQFVSFNPGGGNAVAPSKKILLTFNQVIDINTFKENEDWTLDPKPEGLMVVAQGGDTQVRFNGQYNVGTKYTLTIKPDAMVSDKYGKQLIMFNPMNTKTEFTTAASVQVTAQTPASGARIVKATTAAVPIRLTFNQDVNAASLEATEYTLTRQDGTGAIPQCGTPPTAPCTTVTASGAALTISASALPAGAYRFTLKAGATITDRITMPAANVFTQMGDRVINFTVVDAPPSNPTMFKCLGAP